MTGRSAGRAGLAVAALATCMTVAFALSPALASAPASASAPAHAPSPLRESHVQGTTPALSSEPLSVPPAAADPLAANGFSSPSCTTAALYVQISPAARLDCEVSGVAVAPVPLSNYAFDTSIPSGLDASFDEDLDSIVQELVLTPTWTALVWLVHVAVVALEWCYSIDLLAPDTLTAISSALRGAEAIFTTPWLGLALALAAITFAWHGLVRRRVSETLGQAALMVAMMCLGLWVIADPAGTVGAVSQLADEAALGTVAAAAAANPSEPVASLDDALGEVFDSAITGPWCYLEFGDVDWCRDPSRLDPQLAATGRQLVRLYRAGATCSGSAPGLVQCTPGGSAEQHQFVATVLALSAARTNGALFLALPPGSLTRNALASETPLPSLYATLCGGTDATSCTAGTAPQAEFRTSEGTWPRAGGLMLIAIGIAGMLAMLGFIALRLFGAAIAVLVYLLLAPLLVLAPACGDGGRAAFRHWLTRLVGAVLAKLVYSVLLGVMLLVVRLLASLDTLGWWTDWLVISMFWWLAFEHRHRVLAFAIHERGEPTSRLPLSSRLRYGARAFGTTRRTVGSAGRALGTGIEGAHDAWQQLRRFPPATAPGRQSPGAPRDGRIEGARIGLDAQLERVIASDRASAAALAERAPALGGEIAQLRRRRERLAEAERAAGATGADRRAVSLALRRRYVESQIAARSREWAAAQVGSTARRCSAMGATRAAGATTPPSPGSLDSPPPATTASRRPSAERRASGSIANSSSAARGVPRVGPQQVLGSSRCASDSLRPRPRGLSGRHASSDAGASSPRAPADRCGCGYRSCLRAARRA